MTRRLLPWLAVALLVWAALHFAPTTDPGLVPATVQSSTTANPARDGGGGRSAATGAALAEVLALQPRDAATGDSAAPWQQRLPSQPTVAASAPPPRPAASRPLPTPAAAEIAALAPAPPAPPVLPFRLLGRYADERREGVVLLHDGQVVVAHVGDTVAGQYRVDTVTGDTMVVTYLPMNLKQTFDISVAR